VSTDDAQDVWVFMRALPTERLLVAINASAREAKLDLSSLAIAGIGGSWKTVFGGEGAALSDDAFPRISVPPLSGRVWTLQK